MLRPSHPSRQDCSSQQPLRSRVARVNRIRISEGGLAAFVAPGVENRGVITARLGKVQLALGDAFPLDLHGDGLIQLQLAPGAAAPTNADGSTAKALVSNSGKISADGGVVTLTAAGAQGQARRVAARSHQHPGGGGGGCAGDSDPH